MFDDDDLPTQKPAFQPLPLEDLSIEALHAYITDLEGEIARTKGEIDRKEAAKTGAAAFFKS